MSLYSEKFEECLHAGLTEWAESHRWDARDMLSASFEKIMDRTLTGDGYYGWLGPMSYEMAWKLEKIIEAEVASGVAQMILRDLAAGEKPSEVWDEVKKEMDRCVVQGLTASSSGQFHNAVARSVGQAGHSLVYSHFDLASRVEFAKMKAQEQCVSDETKQELKDARARVREIEVKLSGMRSETRIAKATDELTAAQRTLNIIERIRDNELEEAMKEETTPTTV